MSITNSFLDRAIKDVRRYVDEPSVNAKYTDAVLVEKIEQCYATVIGDINRVRTSPVVARLSITMVAGQYTYPLPPTIGSVWSMYNEDTSTGSKTFYVSKGVWNSAGRGLWIEGNNLKAQVGTFAAGVIVTLEYIPNGTARLHNAAPNTTTGGTVNLAGTIITLGTADTGVIDTRRYAYVGSVFRVLTHAVAAYAEEQERVIIAYTNTAGVFAATLDVALSPNPYNQTGAITYEIAPAINRGLDHVVALYLAVVITALEGDYGRNQMITRLYNQAVRAVRLDGYNSVLDQAYAPPQDGYGRRRRMLDTVG